MKTFDQIFPHESIEKEMFGGSGAVQGKINSCLQIMYNFQTSINEGIT